MVFILLEVCACKLNTDYVTLSDPGLLKVVHCIEK